MANTFDGNKASGRNHGFGDLDKSIREARAEQETARHGKPVVPAEPVPYLRVPRYTAEGMLLNPEECSVSADGFVTGKVM